MHFSQALPLNLVVQRLVKSGMVSNLIMTLTKHASLSQDVLDCDVNYQALEYLCKCRKGLEALSTLEKSGRLPEAVEACDKLEEMLKRIPHPLESSKVMADFKVSIP